MLRGGSRGGFAEGDAFEVGSDEASWYDGQVRDDEEDRAAGGGGFERNVEEAVQSGGEDGDLSEPTEDGKLDQGAAEAGGEQEHGGGKAEVGERGRGAEGVDSLEVHEGDDQPHADGDAEGGEKLADGGDDAEAVAELVDALGCGVGELLGDGTE